MHNPREQREEREGQEGEGTTEQYRDMTGDTNMKQT